MQGKVVFCFSLKSRKPDEVELCVSAEVHPQQHRVSAGIRPQSAPRSIRVTRLAQSARQAEHVCKDPRPFRFIGRADRDAAVGKDFIHRPVERMAR